MRFKSICVTVFLFCLVAGPALFAQSQVGVSPVEEGKEAITIATPALQEEVVSSSKVYTVPRKQVLIEVGTRTT